MKLGIIGLGNMGSAILKGILQKNYIPNKDIFIYDIDEDKVKSLVHQYSVLSRNLLDLCKESNVLLIAVKPAEVTDLLKSIINYLFKQVIISICAGISIEKYESILGTHSKLVRVMPNTPLLVGEGASCLSFNMNVTQQERDFVLKLFEKVGQAFEVPEKLLDAVTGLSGSGPAYVYLFIESLADGGVFAGLPRNLAIQLASQTVLGSVKMLLESNQHTSQLKDMVTSPGGTTIEGLSVLERNGFKGIVMDAVYKATLRSKELGKDSK